MWYSSKLILADVQVTADRLGLVAGGVSYDVVGTAETILMVADDKLVASTIYVGREREASFK